MPRRFNSAWTWGDYQASKLCKKDGVSAFTAGALCEFLVLLHGHLMEKKLPRQSIVGDNDDDAPPSPDAMMQNVKNFWVGHGVANDVHKAEGVLQRVVDWERNFRGSIWVDLGWDWGHTKQHRMSDGAQIHPSTTSSNYS